MPANDNNSGRIIVAIGAGVAGLATAVAIGKVWKGHWPSIGEAIWLIGFLVQGIIRTPHGARSATVGVAQRRAVLSESLMLGAMFVTVMVLPLVHIATPLLQLFDYRLPEQAIYVAGAIELALFYYFWRSHADLGRQWSATLEIRQEHELITKGIYRRMRHPMYLAIWLSTLAQPLLIQNWIAGLAVIPAFALMYFVRVPREEVMMQETFGEAWRDYAAKTPRLAL